MKKCYDLLAEEVISVPMANERYGNKTCQFCVAI